MKKTNLSTALLAIVLIVTFYACTKTDTTVYKSPRSYVSSVKGKYIIYKLDSIVSRSFGTGFQTNTYTVKDSVVDVFTDNSGRESFKIFRFQLNPSNNTWTSTNTFVLTPQDNSVEYVENNLRYIKMVGPIKDGQEWKGNSYINFSPFYSNTSFPSWTYRYENVGQPRTVGAFSFPNTVSITQFDSLENKPFNKNVYNFYDKGYEVYADSLGLVYRDIMSWEYQVFTHFNNCKVIKPKASGVGFDTIAVDCNNPVTNCDSLMQRPNHTVKCDTIIDRFYYNGYGIKQTILSHN